MIANHFYHETLKSATAAFGSLFNDILIKRRDGKFVPVPLAYGPRSKWLEAAKKADNNEMFEKLLPRMSYEMIAMTYDSNRKLTNKQIMRSEPYAPPNSSTSIPIKVPVPYELDFSLYIQTKNLNDGWQIVEQILPFFTPAYTVRVRHFPESITNDSDVAVPTNAYDMPVVLTAVTWADDFTGPMDDQRVVEWTLEFTTKIHLFGPAEGMAGLTKVIYDARAIISTTNNDSDTIYTLDRLTSQVGGEAGYVSIDSDTAVFHSDSELQGTDSELSPFVINRLTDSDGTQVRVIREFGYF